MTALTVGHGTPGLRDSLRDYAGLLDSLVEQSGAAPRPHLELQLGLPAPSDSNPFDDSHPAPGTYWTVYSGHIYKLTNPISISYGGRVRDVVGVQTSIEPRDLTRVEALADVVAGTYFCDVDAVSAGAVDVYVWLPDDSNPESATVVLLLLFGFGVQGAVHPWLSPDKLVDGALDDWSSSSVLAHWTSSLGTGYTLARDAAISPRGTYSAKLSVAAGSTADNGRIICASPFQEVVPGKMYRVSGYYQTQAAGMPTGLSAALLIGDGGGTENVLSDGRTYATASISNAYALRETRGRPRRFFFDFIAGATWTSVRVRLVLWNPAATSVGAGSVWFDDVKLQRIYSWNFYEPRLSDSSIPEREVASQSNTFAGKTVTIGGISIINGDGVYSTVFGQLLKHRKPAQMWSSGFFANGQEIYRDDWRGAFPALTGLPKVKDDEIAIDLEDARSLADITFPPNTYSKDEDAGLDENIEGRRKPVLFGDTRDHNTKAARVGLTAKGFGIYEVLDPEVPVADNAPVDATGSLRVYPNEELADKDEQGYDITDSVNDFSFGTNNTRWTILRDIRNLKYNRGGDDIGTGMYFDFDIGGSMLSAGPVNVNGPAYKVIADIATAMNTAASVANISGAINETTHVASLTRASGTFRLYPRSGPHANQRAYDLIGFDTGNDYTAGGPYAGAKALFESPESDHIIRFVSGGLKDDAAGSICGNASAALDTAPAAVSWILQKVCKVQPAKIDVSSFSDARVALLSEDMQIRAYFGDERSIADVIAEFEASAQMDIVVDGEGIWRCVRNDTTVRRYFTDADYLKGSWEMSEDPKQIYKLVKVLYGYHPAKGEFKKSVTAGAIIGNEVRHGTDRVLEINSHLDDDAGAIAAAAGVLAQRTFNFSWRVPRIATFSAAGKLCDLLPGHRIALSKTANAMSPTGALDAVEFRVLGIRQNDLTGVGVCTAVEAINYLTPPYGT